MILHGAALLVLARSCQATQPPVVGAIRWDAYFAQPGQHEYNDPNFGVVTRTTTVDMSLPEWHYRLPFFSEEINATSALVNGNTADIMGQELAYAAEHGINFWSFCNYPIGCVDMHPPAADCKGIQCCADNVGLSYAWNQYLAHPDRHKVNFTLLLQPGYWFPTALKGGNETLEQEVDRYITYFKMPNYQMVLGNRPLVFVFGGKADPTTLKPLRDMTKQAIGVYPYIVSMNGDDSLPEVDAVSAYVTGGGTMKGGSFQQYIAEPEASRWSGWAAAGKKVIPTVSAGWDNRPRAAAPLGYPCPWGVASGAYVDDPTMAELENHTAAGLTWVQANPKAAETNMMMLSAWNEHDEGHWIAPTLPKYGGTAKLEAIKRAIDRTGRNNFN